MHWNSGISLQSANSLSREHRSQWESDPSLTGGAYAVSPYEILITESIRKVGPVAIKSTNTSIICILFLSPGVAELSTDRRD